MASGVKDLKVWQEAVALAADVVRAVRASAKRETKAMTDQLMATAVGVAAHVADGYSRYTAPEQRVLYRAAKRDLLRLETQLAILRQAELLSAGTYTELTKRVHTVARLLAGYLVYLERQRVAEPEEVAPPRPVAMP